MNYYFEPRQWPYDQNRKVTVGTRAWWRIQWRKTGLFNEEEIELILEDVKEA